MTKSLVLAFLCAVCLTLSAVTAKGQESFRQLVGNVTVQPVATGESLQVPYITWG